MKGLLYKDFCVLKKQVKILVVFVLFYSVWAVAANTPSMMSTMVVLISMMLPVSSMSYDEGGQWYRYAFSLPVSRRSLVLSKYLLGFLTAMGGLLVCSVCNLIILYLTNWENALESWVIIGVSLEVGVIFLSVLIPLLFKFGVEKGRFILIAVAVVPSMLIALLMGTLKNTGITLPSEAFFQAALCASPFFTLAIFLISFRISVGICKKKEY